MSNKTNRRITMSNKTNRISYEIIKSADLSQGWDAYYFGDGTLHLNHSKGFSMQLTKESVDRLMEIMDEIKQGDVGYINSDETE